MPWVVRSKQDKLVRENPIYPLHSVLADVPWQLSSASKTLCLMAFNLIVTFDIDTVLEIGTGNGFSTTMLARALAAGYYEAERMPLLVSIEIDEGKAAEARRIVDLPMIEHMVLTGDSTTMEWERCFESRKRKIGLAFIDGNHKFDYVQKDLLRVRPLVKEHGFILCHDYHPRGGSGVMGAVVRMQAEYPEWSAIKIPDSKVTVDYAGVVLQNYPGSVPPRKE